MGWKVHSSRLRIARKTRRWPEPHKDVHGGSWSTDTAILCPGEITMCRRVTWSETFELMTKLELTLKATQWRRQSMEHGALVARLSTDFPDEPLRSPSPCCTRQAASAGGRSSVRLPVNAGTGPIRKWTSARCACAAALCHPASPATPRPWVQYPSWDAGSRAPR